MSLLLRMASVALLLSMTLCVEHLGLKRLSHL